MPGKKYIEVPADVEFQDPIAGGRLREPGGERYVEAISFRLFVKKLLSTPAFQEDYKSVLHVMEILKELDRNGGPGDVMELAEDDWQPLGKATDMIKFLGWNPLLLPQLVGHFEAIRQAMADDPRKKQSKPRAV